MCDSSPSTLPLGRLAPGDTGIVRRVTCARPVARRLLEMGLLPGTRVKVLRVAPLGDPMELELRGYALSIRRAEAMAIDVARDAAKDLVAEPNAEAA
jgi:ferrous iron transport protein A